MKKLVVTLLAGALISAMMVGCSGGTDTGTTTTTTSTTTPAPDKAGTTTTSTSTTTPADANNMAKGAGDAKGADATKAPGGPAGGAMKGGK